MSQFLSPSPQLLPNYKNELFDVVMNWSLSWRGQQFEKCAAAHLTKSGYSVQEFAAGNKAKVIIDTPQLIQTALSQKSELIILAHYHPAINAQPSIEDKRTTRRISLLCRTLEVTLIDHIIFSQSDHFSFRQAGYL